MTGKTLHVQLCAGTSHVLGSRDAERRESTEGLSLGSAAPSVDGSHAASSWAESWVQTGSWWKRLPCLFDQMGQGRGSHAARNQMRPPGHRGLCLQTVIRALLKKGFWGHFLTLGHAHKARCTPFGDCGEGQPRVCSGVAPSSQGLASGESVLTRPFE